MNPTPNVIPGKNITTPEAVRSQFFPPRVLYSRPAAKPPTMPKNMYMKIADVIRDPRVAGEIMPNIENRIAMVIIQNSWHPLPMITENSSKFSGGRKTSPCTSFQPVCSSASSASSSLYLAMSLRRVRTMINALRDIVLVREASRRSQSLTV